MTGIKDVVPIKTAKQNHLLLSDLTDLYSTYMVEHKVSPASFSKFAQFRPQKCILAGASNTHTVCVCTIHENCKLMINAIDLKNNKRPIQNFSVL